MQNKLATHEEFETAVFESAFQALKRGEKPIVLVAGASASGKGYLTEKLQQQLELKGLKTFVLCLDDFYKGISLTITGKANTNFFNGKLDCTSVADTVRNVIENSSFVDKFSNENCMQLINNFSPSYGIERATQLVQALKTEFERINFDEPDAVNLTEAAKVIEQFASNQPFSYPVCGMDFAKGEHKHTAHAELTNQYDVLVVEGLYALNNAMLSKLNVPAASMTKLFIHTDFKTMLVRRLSRDILQGRSSMSGEGNLRFMLEVVLPAYHKHILPSEQLADYFVVNQLGKSESYAKPKPEIQEKVMLKSKEQAKQVLSRLQQLGFKSTGSLSQEDWFFDSMASGTPDLENLVRLRIENGIVQTCLYKGCPIYSPDGKIVRPTEVFLSKDSFSHFKRRKEELIDLFIAGGLKPFATVEKKRMVWQQEGGAVTVNLDQVNGLGTIVELATKQSFAELNALKHQLGIENLPNTKAYLEEVMKRRKEVMKVESELKFVLESMPNWKWETITSIEQTYLNLQSEEVKRNLKNAMPFANLSGAKEARVRIENGGERCILTLKNASAVSRSETETQISLKHALDLTSNNVVGKIFKVRHTFSIANDLTLEVDLYSNQNLITAEVEFDKNKYNEQQIELLVHQKLGKAKNVTHDSSYKNANLCKQ